MSEKDRRAWATLSAVILQASAAATALSTGFISNHGEPLGDPQKAMALAAVAARLDSTSEAKP